MELTVIGCSGSASGPTSPASSYLVQAPFAGRTFSLVMDLGPGAFGALYRYLDPAAVDAIALSHLHPDHCLDVCAFYVGSRYSATAPWPRIPVYGPAGTAERLSRAYEVPPADGFAAERGPTIVEHFDYQRWRAEQRVGPFTVTTTRTAHPVEAYAIRVSERGPGGGSLTYTGDTGPAPDLVGLARGTDLLLVESAFVAGGDNPPDLHLTGAQAAELGTAAGVGTVVLTHIPPWHDPDRVLAEAAPHFAGEVALARPGSHWTVGGDRRPGP